MKAHGYRHPPHRPDRPIHRVGRQVWQGLAATGIALVTACAPLEPIVEPEVSDLQLMVDTLKTSVRDAQRTIAELRTELDASRQALADAQIARAQLEGRVREAERRLGEARHVIELQREELAASRAERERVARSGAALNNQMKQLQKQLSRLGKQAGDARAPDIAPASQSAAPAGRRPAVSTRPLRVSVKPGDTLWRIAQRYRIDVNRLVAINRLADERIHVGQALWLTEPPAAESEGDKIK
jgi:flagellar biosynthesis chaperone FliJ